MNKPVFFKATRGVSFAEIAQMTGASAPAGFTCTIGNVAPLDRAGPGDLSFFDQRRYLSAAAATHASACLTSEALAKELPPSVAVLVVTEPFAAFVVVARALFPDALRPSSLYKAGTNAGANVHVEARLESGVTVEPGAVVGPRAEIGSGTVISATAVIGPEVRVGRDCSIGPGAVITNALLGDRVIIHPGCTIGKDGFGFIMSGGRHMKVPQIGRVIIQDDVEIGASTTVDRGALRDTVIGEGTKIDNQVQVGHNVSIGRHCILVAQAGIAGSATLEDYVVLGARVGVNNNARIGEGAQIAALSSVTGHVPAGARWGGTPAKPIKYWLREMRMVARLARRGGVEAAADE